MSGKFRSCPLYAHNKRGADAGFERDHYSKVAYVHLHVFSATSGRVESCDLVKFTIDCLYDSIVACYLERYLADRTAYILSNALSYINEHWAAINSAPFSSTKQVVGYVPKGVIK